MTEGYETFWLILFVVLFVAAALELLCCIKRGTSLWAAAKGWLKRLFELFGGL